MDWKDLTLRERIGQTVNITANRQQQMEFPGGIKAFLEKYPIGSLTVGADIIHAASEKPKALAEVVRQYQSASRVPLLISGDMEAGGAEVALGLTDFGSLMSLGATGSKTLAYKYGKATALDAKSVGLNWTFAPVSDLNKNPLNPITNTRALTDDANLAMRLLPEVIRGMQENGLAATAKHFPGDGMDFRNQHLVTSVNSLSAAVWRKEHGAVFQRVIDAGVYAIMIGHIALPAFQRKTIRGEFLPATLSKELITNLLKRRMCFRGVVVSDALIMGGIRKVYDTRQECEIECFKAGTDVMLWPGLDWFDNLERAIQSGAVSCRRLDDAVERIWTMKKRLGLFDRSPLPVNLTTKERGYAKRAQIEVAEKCLTLVRDRTKMLPLVPEREKKILLVTLAYRDQDYKVLREDFKGELENAGFDVTVSAGLWIADVDGLEEEYDVILYAVHTPISIVDFFLGQNASGTLWTALCFGRRKSMMISFGSPYLANWYFNSCDCCINAYSASPERIKAVVRAITGKSRMTGKSPVDLTVRNC